MPAPEPEVASPYPRADVTLDGLYNLLGAVQDAFPTAFSADEFYRAARPPPSVRKVRVCEVCVLDVVWNAY